MKGICCIWLFPCKSVLVFISRKNYILYTYNTMKPVGNGIKVKKVKMNFMKRAVYVNNTTIQLNYN